ncbi:unnamed protein product [Leuciscus chuanchicus]
MSLWGVIDISKSVVNMSRVSTEITRNNLSQELFSQELFLPQTGCFLRLHRGLKYPKYREGTIGGGNIYPELHLDPGSCGVNTSSTSPKFLVPGESSCGGNAAMMGSKVEVVMKKAEPITWARLDTPPPKPQPTNEKKED